MGTVLISQTAILQRPVVLFMGRRAVECFRRRSCGCLPIWWTPSGVVRQTAQVPPHAWTQPPGLGAGCFAHTLPQYFRT